MDQFKKKIKPSQLGLLTIGTSLMAGSVGGFLLGYFVDAVFHSHPTGMLIGGLGGFISGLVRCWKKLLEQPLPPDVQK